MSSLAVRNDRTSRARRRPRIENCGYPSPVRPRLPHSGYIYRSCAEKLEVSHAPLLRIVGVGTGNEVVDEAPGHSETSTTSCDRPLRRRPANLLSLGSVASSLQLQVNTLPTRSQNPNIDGSDDGPRDNFQDSTSVGALDSEDLIAAIKGPTTNLLERAGARVSRTMESQHVVEGGRCRRNPLTGTIKLY
jgi:hypothetical protein